MLKTTLLGLLLMSTISANDYSRANTAADKSLRDLDCEFEDCSKKAPEPKVIIKEKIVERPVVVEKVVYKERPAKVETVVVEKVVYKDRPIQKTDKPQKIDSNRIYKKLYVDISVPNDPTFLSDFLYITPRAGGIDWNRIKKMCLSAPTRGPYTVKVTGMMEVPENITSDRIYVQPVAKKITNYLNIDGTPWNTQELNIKNAYKKSKAIPFNFTYTSKYYHHNINDFFKDIEALLPNVRFLISNKPVNRGEKKEFGEAKIFIPKS
ncbi:MAG: hypothetical protein U9O86_04825 [Campylobacterota bacterium]|nr:hypothetical protein [Campylobacterota bacterium]